MNNLWKWWIQYGRCACDWVVLAAYGSVAAVLIAAIVWAGTQYRESQQEREELKVQIKAIRAEMGITDEIAKREREAYISKAKQTAWKKKILEAK